MLSKLKRKLISQRDRGLRRKLKKIDKLEGKFLHVDNKKFLNMSSNDYLGLSSDKALLENINKHNHIDKLGVSSSRSVCGNLKRSEEVEKIFADYFGFEQALFFPSGYQANIGVISALFDEEDVVLYDKRIHTSLAYGLMLSKAQTFGFNHSNWEHLEKKASKYLNPSVVLESLYSMDGDIINVEKVQKFKNDTKGLVIVDEAHSFGVLGEKGSGLAKSVSDISIGTLGKAFGYHGAFVLCSNEIKDYLINFCSAFKYTTGLPKFHYDISEMILSRVSEMDEERLKLAKLSSYAKNKLEEMDLNVKGDAHILSIVIGDEQITLDIAEKLWTEGIYVFPARYPTTPYNKALIRLGITINHDESDIEHVVSKIREIMCQ